MPLLMESKSLPVSLDLMSGVYGVTPYLWALTQCRARDVIKQNDNGLCTAQENYPSVEQHFGLKQWLLFDVLNFMFV